MSALKGAGQGGPAPEWSIAHKREAAGCRRCRAIPAARRAALKQLATRRNAFQSCTQAQQRAVQRASKGRIVANTGNLETDPGGARFNEF